MTQETVQGDAVCVGVGIILLLVRRLLHQQSLHVSVDSHFHLVNRLAPSQSRRFNVFAPLWEADIWWPPVQIRIGMAAPKFDWCGNDVKVEMTESAYRLARADVSPIAEEAGLLGSAWRS